MASSSIREALRFPQSERDRLKPYLPPSDLPFLTLTFATSLDSNLSLSPGVQTVLSGPGTKALTHYLRSVHDGILIGAGTAIADDPSLNCRLEGVGGYGGNGLDGQPRPIVLDPRSRWKINKDSKVVKLAREGKGKAPWIFSSPAIPEQTIDCVEEVGGRVFVLQPRTTTESGSARLDWLDIISTLEREGINSIMVEGGGTVINDLLSPSNLGKVDAAIITIAPTWLGKNGVQVCPDEHFDGESRIAVGRLKEPKWIPLGEDVVLCGFPKDPREISQRKS